MLESDDSGHDLNINKVEKQDLSKMFHFGTSFLKLRV